MLDDLPRLALFALAALFVVGLVAAQRKSTASLRRSRTDLENKVRDLERLNAALQIENTERQRAEQRAREIERELQLTIDMIPVKITVYRADGARHSVNRPWRDYTGLSQEDIEGQSWAIIPHPDDLKASEAEWKVRLANREPFQAEMRLRRRDGAYLSHMVHRVPLRDQAGEVVKWYAVAFDIEDRKRAEDALRQSEASLAEAQRLSRTGQFRLVRLERRHRLVRGELPNIRVRPRDRGHDRQGARPGASGRRRACPGGDRACIRAAERLLILSIGC